MKLLSSPYMVWVKRVPPIAVALGIAALIVVVVTHPMLLDDIWVTLYLGLVAVAAVAGLILSLYPLADEVYDYGDHLRVTKGGLEARIPLADIEQTQVGVFLKPTRVVLLLSKPCALGKRISFYPPILVDFNVRPCVRLAEDLLARARKQRATQPSDGRHVGPIKRSA